jgi:dephospho-CoA kinase
MRVIGLTGGIGTGKSEVSRILKDLGAVVINADQLGHEAYRPHSETWQKVVKAFGGKVLGPGDEIDRKRLGDIVFSDPQARATLDSIVHPQITEMARAKIEALRRQGFDTIVFEAAILLEAGWDSLVDEVWVTHAPEETVLKRLKERNHLSEDSIKSRIRAQLSSEERINRGQVLIENTTTLEELKAKVEILWNSRLEEGSNKNA